MTQHSPVQASGLPILIVGGVTIDTVHLPERAEPLVAPGGAGLFTALGARSAGGRVTLFAQRPDPVLDLLSTIDLELSWQGPAIPLPDLPRLEIAHYGQGKAELLAAHWGAQPRLSPEELSSGLAAGALCHIAALGPTERQLRFTAACRAMEAHSISAGTYGRAAHGETSVVRELVSLVDYFFMNANEARGLFGDVEAVRARSGQVVFVTLGAQGALAVSGEKHTHRPATPMDEVNPTGAGDTFCGAALAVLAQGGSVEEALEVGVRIASAHVGG